MNVIPFLPVSLAPPPPLPPGDDGPSRAPIACATVGLILSPQPTLAPRAPLHAPGAILSAADRAVLRRHEDGAHRDAIRRAAVDRLRARLGRAG